MEQTKRHALSVVLDMIIYIQIQEKETYFEKEKVKIKKRNKEGKSKGVGKNAEEPSIHPYWPIPALYRSQPAESLTWLCPKRRLNKADSDCTITNILLKTETQMLFQSRMGPSLRKTRWITPSHTCLEPILDGCGGLMHRWFREGKAKQTKEDQAQSNIDRV